MSFNMRSVDDLVTCLGYFTRHIDKRIDGFGEVNAEYSVGQ